MDNIIITIGREFGSGGKYIGEKLAKNLNMKFYDKELLNRVAKEENLDIKLLEENDEIENNNFWYSVAMSLFSTTDSVNSLSELPLNEQYFIKESHLIEKISKTESAVIIGRCSNIILKNNPNTINIFVYSSDTDFKIKRKIEFENLDKKHAEKIINKKDKKRATYYNYYTNEIWGDRKNYDLLVDTSKLGIENSINLIESYIKLKTNK